MTDTEMTDSEAEFTEVKKTRSTKKRKLEGSPQVGKTNNGKGTTPLIIEMDPVPNSLELARTLRQNFGENIGQTKPLRSAMGFLLITTSGQRNQITTEKLKQLFPRTKINVREPRPKPSQTIETGHFIIKGTDTALEMEDIKTELRMQKIEPIRLNRINSLKFNAPTRLVRVITKTKEEAERAIQKGVFIGLQRHRCEKPHNSDQVKVQQCYNCQGFGHIAANCENNQKCPRCGENHNLKNCEKPKEESKCPNCNEGHPASYKGCATRKEEVTQQKKLYSQALEAKKPVTKAEVTKSLEETTKTLEVTIEKAESEIQLARARIETDYKETIRQMENQLKKLEEGTYIFVATISLWIKNLVGDTKKVEAAKALGQVAELAKRAFGKDFSPNLQEYKRK